MNDIVEQMEVEEESPVKHVKPKKPRGKGDATKHVKGRRKENVEVIDLTKSESEDSLFKEHDDDSDNEDGLPELDEVLPKSATELAEDRRQMGNTFFKKGEYHKAIELYSQAIDGNPEEAAYYGNRSAAYMMLKKYKEALDDARMSVQKDPGFAKGWTRIVKVSLALGDVKACETAIDHIQKSCIAVDIFPEMQNLAHLRQYFIEIEKTKELKDYRKVVFLADRALSIANGNYGLRTTKAEALIQLGRHTEASDICMEILHANVNCVDALYLKAQCFYHSDNLDKAFQFLKQGIQFAPDHEKCKVYFKKIKQLKERREEAGKLYASGKFAEAKEKYLSCLEIVNEFTNVTIESKLNYNLSLIAHKTGELDDSLEYCNKAIKLNGEYLKAIAHRAKVYLAKEMYDESVRDYEAALKLDPSAKDVRNALQNAKMAAKRAKRKDYYKILAIDQNATDDEIRKAYKKRAMVHHPDRHANATEEVRKEQERLFKDVGEAYEVLSDSKKKARYDAGHDLNDIQSDYTNIDPHQIFNVFFQGGGMPGGGRTRYQQYPSGYSQFF